MCRMMSEEAYSGQPPKRPPSAGAKTGVVASLGNMLTFNDVVRCASYRAFCMNIEWSLGYFMQSRAS